MGSRCSLSSFCWLVGGKKKEEIAGELAEKSEYYVMPAEANKTVYPNISIIFLVYIPSNVCILLCFTE